MVRDGDWKYVAGRGSGEPIALHNLIDDPCEMENLVGADAGGVAEVRLALQVQLDEWRSAVGVRTG